MTFVADDKTLADLKRWEGSVGWIYLDVRGLPTVGVGNLLATKAAALQLPFLVVNGAAPLPATPGQIGAAYDRVKGMIPARSPDAYRLHPSIELAAPEIDHLLRKRLDNEFLPGLRQMFQGWDNLPATARSGLLDMAFNLGLGGLRRFEHLREAVQDRKWLIASKECNRRTCRDSRNQWTREQFLEASLPPVVS